jgi:hypothetical protein
MLYRLVRPMKRKGSRNGYFQRRISAYSDASIVDDFHHGVGDDLDARLCSRLASRIRSTAAPPVLWRARASNPRSCGRSSDQHEREERAYGLATSLDASASPTVKWALARRLRSPPAGLPAP